MVKLGRAIPRNISFTSKTFMVIYLLKLFHTGKPYTTIRSAYQAINYFHSIAGHPKTCDSEFCINTLEDIKCTIRYTIQKKSSIIVKHLYKLYSHFRRKLTSLTNLRTAQICDFLGFLCFSEVINVRRTDVVIRNTTLPFLLKGVNQSSIKKEMGLSH